MPNLENFGEKTTFLKNQNAKQISNKFQKTVKKLFNTRSLIISLFHYNSTKNLIGKTFLIFKFVNLFVNHKLSSFKF